MIIRAEHTEQTSDRYAEIEQFLCQIKQSSLLLNGAELVLYTG